MPNKQIIIVNFKHTASREIGGRRWLLFAKFMARQGYTVHVICAKQEKGESLWNSSDENGKIILHELSAFYPQSFASLPTTLTSKLKYQFWMRALPLMVKGSFYDRASFFEKAMQQQVETLCTTHKIDQVYITCAPFKLAHYGVKLKKRFGFFLTVDFRDPWTWADAYGYALLNPKRKAHDEALEKEVVAEADLITSPAAVILQHLQEKYAPNNPGKFKLLSHGYDPDDLNIVTTQERADHRESKQLNCIYGGTVYGGSDQFIQKLIQGIAAAKSANEELYNNFHYELYSLSDTSALRTVVASHQLQHKINFNEAIPAAKLFEKIKESDYCLVFFPTHYKDFISTKFYELIALRIPIVYVGEAGIVWDFLNDNKLGLTLSIDDFENTFCKLTELLSSFEYNSSFAVESYSFPQLTEDLLRVVNDKVA
jgi:glycosyltransferase involved in cell wall biosynthesis